MSINIIFIQALLGYLFTDLLVGVLCWLDDTPITRGLRLWWINRVLKPLNWHHAHQRKTSWRLHGLGKRVLLGLIYSFICVMLFGATWLSLYLIGLGALGGMVHVYNQRKPKERPQWVQLLQHYHWLQSPQHHLSHYLKYGVNAYCVLSPFLNPVLGKLQFWSKLELGLTTVFSLSLNPHTQEKPATRPTSLKGRGMKGRVYEYHSKSDRWVCYTSEHKKTRPAQ